MESAILNIRACSPGSEESRQWARQLLGMYVQWAAWSGFLATIKGARPGLTLETATLEIVGLNVPACLQSEIGVHRRVRISPFDGLGRRHTSFAIVLLGDTLACGNDDEPTVRHYVTNPYHMVRDTRTKLTTNDVDGVLGGDLQPFMDAFRLWRLTGKLAGEPDPDPDDYAASAG